MKKGVAQPIRAAQGKIQAEVDNSNRTVWYYAGNEYAVPTDQWNEILRRHKDETDREHQEVINAGSSASSAPNATKRGASTINCADAPAGRATPVPPAFISRLKTI